MNTGKHWALAGLMGALAFGVAHAQSQSSPGPERAPPPLQREPGTQPPAPSGSGSASSSSRQHGYSEGHATATTADPAAFVKKAAQDGMTEVALGKVAESMAKDASVREFGQEMVKDHSKANNELAALAKRKGFEVPTALDSEHQAIVQKLKSKSGADFDHAYSKQMMEDHEKAVTLFEGAAKSSDRDLAAFAQKTLPTLEEHKEKADALPSH
jgi:putative membrane protein